MSGNYGDIVLGDFNLPTTNSDFMTVEAAPGQTPVFTTLGIERTNKWVFNAIKVQSLLGTNGNRVAAKDHSRRLQRVFDRATKGHPTHVTVQAARYSSFDPDRWWETRGGVRTEIIELQKLLLDFVRRPFSS